MREQNGCSGFVGLLLEDEITSAGADKVRLTKILSVHVDILILLMIISIFLLSHTYYRECIVIKKYTWTNIS